MLADTSVGTREAGRRPMSIMSGLLEAKDDRNSIRETGAVGPIMTGLSLGRWSKSIIGIEPIGADADAKCLIDAEVRSRPLRL